MSMPSMSQLEFRKVLQSRGLTSALLDDAIRQAERSHKDQLRDNGNPYLIEHVYPVAYETTNSYDGPIPTNVVAAAILHDCIEDDPTFTYKQCKEQFGKEIADMVQALTKNDKENAPSTSQEEKTRFNRIYMQRLASGPDEAMIIKLADRYCNLATIQTIKDTNPAKYYRYIQETTTLFLPVAEKRSPYFYTRLSELLHDLQSIK